MYGSLIGPDKTTLGPNQGDEVFVFYIYIILCYCSML